MDNQNRDKRKSPFFHTTRAIIKLIYTRQGLRVSEIAGQSRLIPLAENLFFQIFMPDEFFVRDAIF